MIVQGATIDPSLEVQMYFYVLKPFAYDGNQYVEGMKYTVLVQDEALMSMAETLSGLGLVELEEP